MDMKEEVLLSCMNQNDFSIVRKCNVRTDALVINQHTTNAYDEVFLSGRRIRMFSSTKRGLSNSRNYALSQADGDLCLLCDDDVTYMDDYERIVVDAFRDIPQADVVVFNIERVNTTAQGRPIMKVRQAPFFSSYGSVRIAFRLKSVRRANVWFRADFGAGSKYSLGEETLWLHELRRKGLKVYEHPAIIGKVDYSQSTWFVGRNEKYYYDKGAFLAAWRPFSVRLLKHFLAHRLRDNTKLTKREILLWMQRGCFQSR